MAVPEVASNKYPTAQSRGAPDGFGGRILTQYDYLRIGGKLANSSQGLHSVSSWGVIDSLQNQIRLESVRLIDGLQSVASFTDDSALSVFLQ